MHNIYVMSKVVGGGVYI